MSIVRVLLVLLVATMTATSRNTGNRMPATGVSAFVPTNSATTTTTTRNQRTTRALRESTFFGDGDGAGDDEDATATSEPESPIETYLAQAYPTFYNLVMCNAVDVLKALRRQQFDTAAVVDDGRQAYATIFAPNDAAFAALGDKKLQQLRDPRNLETVAKIAAYHVVVDDDDLVTADLILNANNNVGGVLTLAGQVPIGPSQSGGFMGLGAKDDGGVVVGPEAKIVQSTPVGPAAIVHEVNGLVAPNLIWRYMDQLRLPGL